MPENRFQRTTLTWLSYGLLAFHTFLQAMISACMPFLRPEFNLDYTRTSLFLSVNALGMVLAGLLAGRLAALIGRRRLLYLSFSGSTTGLLLMALGRVAEIPLAGSFLCGFFGPLMMVLVQAFLSDIHGESKAVALSEANIIAGIGSLVAPLIVSAVVSVGLDWRGAPWFTLLFPLVAAAVFWKVSLPESPSAQPGSTRARLPLSFWLIVVVTYLSVSAEWSVIFWSADFLEKVAGFSKTAAAACISGFFAVMVLSRYISSRLVRNFAPQQLLFIAQGIGTLGVLLFWLAPWSFLRVVGLFISSAGISNLFPLSMIETFNRSGGDTNTASARATFAAGLAILTAPLFLGGLADNVGIQTAYGAVLALLLLGMLVGRLAARKTP